MASDFEKRTNRRPPSPHSLTNERDRERISPGPATSLTHADIAQAMLDSPDGGGTLDFSHKNLGDVGESGAEELATIGRVNLDDECTVLRVALGYNRLATLPMAFALLARLRYLNLRANNFTVFPDVLTVMPSLEILDISRNKLKRLPSQPGTLLGLRVFSISKNKLTRLPVYISHASKLSVFQLDHNPLEWPPKPVLEPLENAEDADTMISCIENVKQWISDHWSGSFGDRAKIPDISKKLSDESTYRAQPSRSIDSDLTTDEFDAYVHSSLSRGRMSSPSQHTRSFSTESDISNYSAVSYESSGSEAPFYREQDTASPELAPPLHISNIISTPLTSSPSASPTVSLPDNSASAAIDDHMAILYHAGAQSSLTSDIAMHGRNASYSVAREPSPLGAQLSVKKSLPNLRGANTTITERTRNYPHRPRMAEMPGARTITAESGEIDTWNKRNLLTSPADQDESFASHVTPGAHSERPHTPSHSRTPRSQPSNNHHRGIVSATVEPMPSPLNASPNGPAPSMDVERNSYFRRLSTLPPSTISATIPESLLVMIDSVRGILFAVSQIYQSLRHYTVFAIDDRLSGLLGKVLDPASTYMTHLINALDRFDSVSRRGIPPPPVCRGVLESCRDNVAVFGKVVGVLHLQLKVLAGSDDARYSRSLLLMLYGSMAEISNSWQTMTPHLEAIQPLLSEHRPPPPVASSSKVHIVPTTPITPSSTRTGLSPYPERQPPLVSPIPRTTSGQLPGSGTNGRSRMTRRHAGSFSTRDVQIGKALPSTTEEYMTSSVSSPSVLQPLRSAMRKPMPSSHVPSPYPHSQSSSVDSPSSLTHSRQESHSSPVVPGGNLSPYPLPYSHHQDSLTSRNPSSSLEVPSDSSKMVDEDLLDTMEAATETARSVWRMMDEILHDTKETNAELLESLEKAQDITGRLKDNIQAMRGGTADGDRKTFWEDAHLFVKAVVNVSTILKAFSVSHPFSAILRSNIARLTQSTQDFAILLQVSSFSPTPTPGPYSPALTPPTPGKSSSGGLSRSRSAQPPSNTKLKSGELRDVPWSAMPHQTFKILTNP